MTPGSSIPTVTLNDDRSMPTLGIGVGELSDAETERAVTTALELGCRLIDTAKVYGNEAAVGRAIAASGIPREEVFVTTKLANADQGLTSAIESCKASLDRLGLDYVDLYLIHWPAPALGMYVDSFGGLIQTRELGMARSIGVCNFTAAHLDDIIDLAFETPSVNQIELHPLLNQAELRAVNAERGIITQAYSPLAVGRLMDHPTVTAIAGEYGKTPAQVLIRWNLQLGNSVIPRSAQPERIAENLDVFDFELADEHMASLDGLNDGTRLRADPLTYSG
ncbi:aldo/keto reductase [Mycolicibacter minnesotensis]